MKTNTYFIKSIVIHLQKRPHFLRVNFYKISYHKIIKTLTQTQKNQLTNHIYSNHNLLYFTVTLFKKIDLVIIYICPISTVRVHTINFLLL